MARKLGKRTLLRGIHIRDGKYVVVQVVHEGVTFSRKQIGTLTQNEASNRRLLEDAEAYLGGVMEQIRTGKLHIEQRYERWTLEKACDTFFEIHGSKKTTAYTIGCYLRHIKAIFPNRYLDTFTQMDTERLRAELAKRGIKESSINRYHTVYSEVFNKVKRWSAQKMIPQVKLPEVNPGTLVKKADERIFIRKRLVSPEEFYKVYEVATPRLKNILLMAINTLLRKNDLEAMTKSANLSMDTCAITGVQSKVEDSSGEPYNIAITPTIMDIIEAAPGDRILDFTNFRKEFEGAVKQAGVTPFLFKDLRRTGARMLLKNQVDIATIQRMLGHTNIITTQRYVGAMSEDVKQAGLLLSSFFPAPQSHTSAHTRGISGDTKSAGLSK